MVLNSLKTNPYVRSSTDHSTFIRRSSSLRGLVVAAPSVSSNRSHGYRDNGVKRRGSCELRRTSTSAHALVNQHSI